MFVTSCPIKLVPSNTTAEVLYGEAPVAKSAADVIINDVGSPARLVNEIEAEAEDGVAVAVATVSPPPPPPEPSYEPVTPKILTFFLMFPAVKLLSPLIVYVPVK